MRVRSDKTRWMELGRCQCSSKQESIAKALYKYVSEGAQSLCRTMANSHITSVFDLAQSPFHVMEQTKESSW